MLFLPVYQINSANTQNALLFVGGKQPVPDFSVPLFAQNIFQTKLFNVETHSFDKFLARFDNIIRTAEKIHVAVNNPFDADTVGLALGRSTFNGLKNVKIHIRILIA